MTPVRAQELMRDFIRSRRDWELFGWPNMGEEDANYLRMLEAQRISGRIKIEGELKTIPEYEAVLHGERTDGGGPDVPE